MRMTLATTMFVLLTGFASAQGVTGGFFNLYRVDVAATSAQGMTSPIAASSMTDSVSNLNMQAFPMSFPVVMLIDRGGVLGSTINLNAFNNFGVQIDLRDKGSNGYSEQILFTGYDNPGTDTWTTASGALSTTATIPACTTFLGTATCITNPSFDQFEISSQAILFDPTNAPFNLSASPATQGVFDNGYREYPLLSGDNSSIFNFKQGFIFRFYGTNFSQAFVSANGFVSFGAADTSFPSITVNSVRLGVRRIMSFYNDLVPEGMPYPTTRIYAQQFVDATGLTKVKFVHDHLAEFSNATGPHGGEIVITDNDDIAVFVPGYNGAPSINTAVGITPGGGVDGNVAVPGQDLSARYGTMHIRGPGKAAYEVFDHGPPAGVINPLDLSGFANVPNHPVGPGIVFLKNPAAANTAPSNSSYIIQ